MEVAASNSPTAHLGEQREQRRGAADVVLVVEQRLAHRLTHGLGKCSSKKVWLERVILVGVELLGHRTEA